MKWIPSAGKYDVLIAFSSCLDGVSVWDSVNFRFSTCSRFLSNNNIDIHFHVLLGLELVLFGPNLQTEEQLLILTNFSLKIWFNLLLNIFIYTYECVDKESSFVCDILQCTIPRFGLRQSNPLGNGLYYALICKQTDVDSDIIREKIARFSNPEYRKEFPKWLMRRCKQLMTSRFPKFIFEWSVIRSYIARAYI